MSRIEIEEIDNGWIVYNDCDGKRFCKDTHDVEKEIKRIVKMFKKLTWS